MEGAANQRGKNLRGLQPSDSEATAQDGEASSENSAESFAGAMAWIASGTNPQMQSAQVAPQLDGSVYGRLDAQKAKSATQKTEGAVEIPAGMTEAGKTMTAAEMALVARAANAAQAQSRTNTAAKASPFSDVKAELEKRNDIRSNGVLTGALIAGPSEPWKSNWVFGDRLSQAQMSADPKAAASVNSMDMSKLMEAMGGDESQIRTGGRSLESLMQDLDSMQATASQNGPVNRMMGGEDFLNSLAPRNQAMNPSTQLIQRGETGFAPKTGESLTSQTGSISIDQGRLGALKPKNGSSDTSFGSSLNEGPNLALTAGSLAALANGKPENVAPAPIIVAGNVVPGSMMKDRLTSESLLNLSSGISKLKGAGGGEMKIRLNPDHLGELVIRVTTQGNQVGLKVQATKNEAKRILEESVSSLKDSLMGQSLQLAKLDVTVSAPQGTNDTTTNSNSSWNQNSQNAGMNDFGREAYAEQSSNRGSDSGPGMTTKRSSLSSTNDPTSTPRAAAGRLDVRA